MPFSCATGTKPLDCTTARELGCVSIVNGHNLEPESSERLLKQRDIVVRIGEPA
jgi:hypothetical protein